MENELSWSERHITTRNPAYKRFVKELESNPEEFFNKGLTNRQERFLKIYDALNFEKTKDDYQFNVVVKFNNKAELFLSFENNTKAVSYIEKSDFAEKKSYLFRDIPNEFEVSISNAADKEKFLSDVWAKELEKRTGLSSGLTVTQIDERQAFHYRNYETEAKKSGLEIIPLISEEKIASNSHFSSRYDEEMEATSSGFQLEDIIDYENSIGKNKDEEIIGKITFYESGEVMEYTSIDTYLNALEREFDSNIGAFKYETLLRNPELLKKVDDLIYSIHGEENPNSLDSYVKKVEKEKDIEAEVLQNPVNDAIQQITEKIRALHRERNYELLADNFSAAKEIEHKINELEIHINNLNQNPNSMETQKEFDQTQYLKAQLRYLGFGEDEKLHKDLEKGINSKNQQFEIKTTSDKTLPGNKIDYTLNYNKTEKGGIFLNSYDANLINEKGESVSQNFRVSKDNSYTAKEAINLLEGRSVKIEFDNPKSNEREPAFVKLNFGEEKNQWGNYNFQVFYKKYGVNAADIVEKSNLVFDKPEFKADTIKSLEKGNVVKVKFEIEDKVIEGKAVLNPQNRNLNLYDNDMTRINTNEPIKDLEADNNQEKNNVKEQSKSRGI
ncbi:hypothetical protein [Elizabethkingia sp. M8]|uniref:hypothetical protein n=1 Tax=Elizabethkingia sp. M8 TaxID=2796140 RepID=UPI0019032D2E|nr:hypothetical protein [Elizabethkingia sp. M8]QQM25863.1 hypothetical protein JCR23_13400 [Elizabethkingia sp. M8]